MPTAAATLQILSPGDYDAVRAAVDLSLDADTLPDSVIEQPVFGPAAESELLSVDPDALGYESGGAADPVKWARVVRAAVLFTAARLAPALPSVTGESLGDYRVNLKPPDLLQRAGALRSQARAELRAYLNPDDSGIPQAMWLSAGRRGL